MPMPIRRPWTSMISVVSLVLAAGAMAGATSTQQPVSSQPEVGTIADLPLIRLDQELPWLLSRAGILDLRLHESPSPLDYELTANLLSIASDLDPQNAEFARDMAQAAWLAGSSELMHDATRRIIRNDPKDSVAQLRLISANINMKQTVEERKALYDRFLGDAGKSLDPAVRSRLALDAALLERESGNTIGFLERLHQATRLDTTNKSAASLAAQYYSSVRKDPVTNLEYQLRVLNADPFDPNVHLAIFRMLSSQGALETAERFLSNAIVLFKLETGQAPESIEELRIAIEWQVDGPEQVMRELQNTLNDKRVYAQARVDSRIKNQLPTDDLILPEDIRYKQGIDKLRLLAAHSQDEKEQVRDILDDITRSVESDLGQIAQAMNVRGTDINALLVQVVVQIAELQAMRAVVGLDAELIRKEILDVTKSQPVMAERLASIEPMALFAEGKYQEAYDQSEPFKGSPVIALIRGQSLEKLNRTDEAIELYLRLARSNVANAYGAFAYARLQKLGAADQMLTDAGKEMAQAAAGVPQWYDQIISNPSNFFTINVTQDKQLYREGEQPMLTIRIKNTAPIPLALGPSAPIDSRVLIESVGVQTMHNGFVGDPRPKVLQLDHRLRLEPREELVVQVVADSASTDWLIDQQPGISMRSRWRVVQSFRPRVSDDVARSQQTNPNYPVFGITNSPLGLTTETPVVQRIGLSSARDDVPTLVRLISSSEASARRRGVIAAAARMMSPRRESPPFNATEINEIITALKNTYTRVNREERASMMLVLPHQYQVPAMIEFDDHVAASLLSDALIESQADPLLSVCALLTRTDDPEAPIFEALTHVEDPRVLRVGEIVRARLRQGIPLLGTVGPGLNAMTPTFDGLEF